MLFSQINLFLHSQPCAVILVETEEIADFLRNDFQRIMTINGRAGSGKTVLTCRVLQHLERDQFPNELGEFKIGGIVYLSEISNYKINVANIFAGLLQLIEPKKARRVADIYKEAKVPVDEKIRALLAALPPEPVILLMDNFEDLLNSEGDAINDQELHIALTTILQADSHKLKILITTRELSRQLNMIEPARQYIKHLDEGLPSPFAENVLRKMDKDGHAGLRTATDELLGRVRVATLGYPRALESLYAILRVDRYSNVEELLVEGIPDTVVQKFVGEAFSRLDSTRQKIIQSLAVYNRPVSSAAVDFALQFHVPGVNSAPILERLVSMHFVRREAKRYFLHPADRDYALSRMPHGDINKKIGQGARARTWDQHSLTLRAADYFVEVRKPQKEWKNLDDLTAQLAEFELRCAAGDYDTAASILTDFDFDYLLLWGHYRLTISLHETLKGHIVDIWLRGNNFSILGQAYQNIGEVRKAIEYFEQALKLDRDNNDRSGEGVDLGNLGAAFEDLGEVHKSIEFHEQALSIARDVGSRSGEATAISHLGLAYVNLGEVRKAIEFHERALIIEREIGDRRGEEGSLANLGSVYILLGEIKRAIEYYEQALKIIHEIGDRGAEGAQLGNLGNCYVDLGDERKAIDYYEQQLLIEREIGDRQGESICIENLGYAFLSLKEHQKAQHHMKQAIQIADDISFKPMQQFGRWRSSQALLLQKDLGNARATIEAALQYDVPQYNHNATALHGIIALRQGERKTAQEAFTRSIAQADEILVKTPDYYSALDAKGLALCGFALCARDDGPSTVDDGQPSTVYRQQAIEVFKQARKIAPHAGVVKSVLRLFDELVKCDEEGVLKDVRSAVEGVE